MVQLEQVPELGTDGFWYYRVPATVVYYGAEPPVSLPSLPHVNVEGGLAVALTGWAAWQLPDGGFVVRLSQLVSGLDSDPPMVATSKIDAPDRAPDLEG